MKGQGLAVVIRETVSPSGQRVTLSVERGREAWASAHYVIERRRPDGTGRARSLCVPLVYGLTEDEERRVPRERWGPYRARKGAKARAVALYEGLRAGRHRPAGRRQGRQRGP